MIYNCVLYHKSTTIDKSIDTNGGTMVNHSPGCKNNKDNSAKISIIDKPIYRDWISHTNYAPLMQYWAPKLHQSPKLYTIESHLVHGEPWGSLVQNRPFQVFLILVVEPNFQQAAQLLRQSMWSAATVWKKPTAKTKLRASFICQSTVTEEVWWMKIFQSIVDEAWTQRRFYKHNIMKTGAGSANRMDWSVYTHETY